MEYIKFSTNLPQTLSPKFNKGKETDGKYGKQWYWGVEQNGIDKGLYATEALNKKLEELEPGNKIVTITKREDGTMKYFEVILGMPSEASQATTSPVTPKSNTEIPQDTLNAIRTAFQALQQRVDKLEKEVQGHGTLLEEVAGKDAYDLHTSIDPRDIKLNDKENFADEATKALGL